MKIQYLCQFFNSIVPDYNKEIIEKLFKINNKYSKYLLKNYEQFHNSKKFSKCFCGAYHENSFVDERHIIICKIQSYLVNNHMLKRNYFPITNFIFKEFSEIDFSNLDNSFIDILYFQFNLFEQLDMQIEPEKENNVESTLRTYNEILCQLSLIQKLNLH